MTPEEAIEELKCDNEHCFDQCEGACASIKNYKCNCKDAIIERMLDELLQYRKIGTVKECREAMKKQKAKKCIEEMSDELISRKATYEAFSAYLNRNFLGEISPQTELRVGEIVSVIHSIPTAFDKEKVMEDLNDWMKDAEKWAAKYDEIGYTDNMDLQDMAARCYKNAIEIVEKGGIE